MKKIIFLILALTVIGGIAVCCTHVFVKEHGRLVIKCI